MSQYYRLVITTKAETGIEFINHSSYCKKQVHTIYAKSHLKNLNKFADALSDKYSTEIEAITDIKYLLNATNLYIIDVDDRCYLGEKYKMYVYANEQNIKTEANKCRQKIGKKENIVKVSIPSILYDGEINEFVTNNDYHALFNDLDSEIKKIDDELRKLNKQKEKYITEKKDIETKIDRNITDMLIENSITHTKKTKTHTAKYQCQCGMVWSGYINPHEREESGSGYGGSTFSCQPQSNR